MFCTLWYKGRLTEADTPAIRLGTTPSGLTSAHLYHPPFFYRPLLFDNKGQNVCCKVSLYKSCQRQSCSAINCLSSGINILAWG